MFCFHIIVVDNESKSEFYQNADKDIAFLPIMQIADGDYKSTTAKHNRRL